MRKRIPKIITFFFAALFFFSLVFSFALAEDRRLEVEYPEIFGLKPETVKTLLPEYAKYIFNFSIAIFGLVVFGVLIKGGALYMTSVGNPAKMQDAKEQIFSAFLGLVILLLSYLILTTINPQLVVFKLPFLTKVAEPTVEPPEFTNEEMTLISIEIPLGQMIENGIWKKEEIEKTKNLLDEFEKFLKEEITVNPKFNRISDLNKYLTSLTGDCRCDALTSLCGQPQNFGGDVGCTGDPCEAAREEIDKILGTKNKKGINEEKMEKFEEYRTKITQRYASSTAEAENFLNGQEKIQDCLKKGSLLTLSEYLEQVRFYEEQGWKTVVSQPYNIPSKGDPLTFYCSVGGTIFDMTGEPVFEIPTELTPGVPTGIEEEIEAVKPVYCPAYIPLGDMLDDVIMASYENNENLESIAVLINEMRKEMRNMADRISECNEQNCDIDCSGRPNPCYMEVCGCIPVCPGNPPFPNPCYPNPLGPTPRCLIPKLQEAGICYGKNPNAPYNDSPCPRTSTCTSTSDCPTDYECKEDKCIKDGLVLDSIQETLDKIKLYEDEILKIIKETKASISNDPYVLETSEGSSNLLEGVRVATKFCFSPATDEESPWALLNCEMALGNYGPDGNVIADCHPQSFFCCNPDKKVADQAKASLPTETRDVTHYAGLRPTGPFSPPESRTNDVPYFAQGDFHWRSKDYGCGGTTLKTSGCGPTSMAMVLQYYGKKNVYPPTAADWSLEHNGRICGSGTSWGFFNAIAKAYGLKGCTGLSVANIDNVLSKIPDGPIIVSGRGSPPYTRGGHYIVLTGIDKNYVYINDPARPKLRKKTIAEFKAAGKTRFACQVKQ